MTSLYGSWWDTELMTDRVDIQTQVKDQNVSGQSRPNPVITFSSEPCRIVYGSGRSDVGDVSDLSLDQARVAFARHVNLKRGDILIPRPPTTGQRLSVDSYRSDTCLFFYEAVCTRVT